ncbi:putative PDZ domain-containing RING finger protein 4-like [Scophthalmus maximus]|uniref:Putative PDZ domain-containing RING finger protein 4-like n=1 Tax=Scophthalmus maximus TaxID=52904 RepID=A0A2U9BY98_SCOMX|nr:putative PDZ domain-containing RING finger protein 4-like [Scophthalmus maximus]
MASQTQPDTGSGGGEEVVEVEEEEEEEEEEGVCQRGCGLVVSAGEEHCCVDALRSVTDALEERSAALEHDARMARLRWNRREQSLLAQVSALQDEARLAALRYQRRLHQYTLRVSGVAERIVGHCKRGCGLVVSAGEEHCCVDALRSVTDALEERSAALEHDARMARLRWNRREQSLLAQVSALQDEARLAALRYQRRLHQYTLRVSGVAERIVGHCKV